VRLEYYAEVAFSRRIDSPEDALRLRGMHIWSDEIVAQRFDWGANRSIFMLVVRVFRLNRLLELPMSPKYGGCKSWVELEIDVATEQATPVLSPTAFESKSNQIRTALNLPKEPAWASRSHAPQNSPA
jgi:hypothetical protein